MSSQMKSSLSEEMMESVNNELRSLVELCEHNTELHDVALEFKHTHEIKKREFNEIKNNHLIESEHCVIINDHMRKLLERVVIFACRCTHLSYSKLTQELDKSSRHEELSNNVNSDNSSSVSLYEQMMLTSISLMSNVISEEHEHLHLLQKTLLEHGILEHIQQVFSTDFRMVRRKFQSGFLMEHMRLLANMLYKNASVAEAVVNKQELLIHILNGTKIDDDNPFMAEWAEFAIRNMCEVSSSARDLIRNIKLVKKEEK